MLFPVQGAGFPGSHAAEYLNEAVIDVETVLAAEQGLALFLDSDIGFLLFAQHEGMHFHNGFVEEAAGLFDGPLVHFDHQAAQQLVEVVFQAVLFGVSYLNGELHRWLTFVRVLTVLRAGIMPAGGWGS